MLIRLIGKTVRVVCSLFCHWYVGIAVLAVAACYLVASPFLEETELSRYRRLIKEIPDAELQNSLAKIDNAKKCAALRSTFLAYNKVYGDGSWGRQFADESNKEHGYRFSDIVEIAQGISSEEDREKFIAEHMEVYSWCLKSGWVDLAHKYSETLAELQDMGGESWNVAKKYPITAFVYSAARNDDGLWNWYLKNAEWCVDYFLAIVPDGEESDVVDYLKTLREYQAVLKLARDEINELTDAELSEVGFEGGKSECLAGAYAFVSQWGDVLKPLARVRAPMLISFGVLEHSMGAFDLDTEENRRKAGEQLAVLWQDHETSPVWYQASLDSGEGVVELNIRAPQDAPEVVGQFGEVHVAHFLLEHYGESDKLLVSATHAVAEWEAAGFAVLTRFKDDNEFKELLTRKDIGWKAIPYVLNFGPEVAKEQMMDDPDWVKRYFNEDGSLKKEKTSFIEALPFVGGISTVAKNWAKGYPCTMGEIGWAAFDVVDIAVTAVTLGAAKAVTAPVSEGGKIVAKQATRQLSKQAAKQLARQTLRQTSKAVGKSVSKAMTKQGGKYALKSGAQKAARTFAMKVLVRFRQGFAKVGKMAVTFLKDAKRVSVSLVSNVVKTWKSIPPKVRQGIMRTVSCVMLGVVLWNRTLKLMPGVLHDMTEEVTETLVKTCLAVPGGVIDGIKNAIRDALGSRVQSPVASNSVSWCMGGLCAALIGIILINQLRKARRPRLVMK